MTDEDKKNKKPVDEPIVPRKRTFIVKRDHLERVCEVTQIRGSGPGGQHKNKAYTGVRLFHPPSKIVVTATERRSFQQNRDIAFERLSEKLLVMMHTEKPRKATRTPKGSKRRRLEGKKRRSSVKKNRGKVDW